MVDLDEELQHDGHEAEARCAEDGADEVRVHERVFGCPDEDEIAERDNWDGDFDVGQVELVPVDERGGDRG